SQNSFSCAWRLTFGSFRDGLLYLSNFYCLPGRAGGSPFVLVGLTDLSARLNIRASLGKNVLSFTMPWPLFLSMEQNVEGIFLQRRTWAELNRH
ncbi:MAG: hypothetical protein ABR881_31145, partial [Candidatus Sulfotelmatobacter sp.]